MLIELPAEPRSFEAAWLGDLARQLRGEKEVSRFARWADDPNGFMTEGLHERPWSKQREIADSVLAHRKTAVQSCHGSGKSYIASRLVCWWIASHPVGEAFVVTTAPSGRQVKAILWREINRTHARADLPGRTNLIEWYIGRELVAFGSKPHDYDPTAFQGIHARYVLVVIDEGCGVPEVMVRAAESLCANDNSRMLIIGNPDDPTTYFRTICTPGSGWNTLRISAFDTPNFTGEDVDTIVRESLVGPIYVEELKTDVGEESPIYKSKVLGEFPEQADDGLIPMSWILKAQARFRDLVVPPRPTPLEGEATVAFQTRLKAHLEAWPEELGVDVGGGHDKSVFCHRRGPWARIIKRTTTPDTMETAREMLRLMVDLDCTRGKIDPVGIGHGALDRLKEIGKPRAVQRADLGVFSEVERDKARRVVGVNVGEPPMNAERFENLRAELYWALRQRFQTGDIAIDPSDDKLAGQLTSMRWHSNSRGQICMEKKIDMKKRGLPSPDEADALMLAFAVYGRKPGDFGVSI